MGGAFTGAAVRASGGRRSGLELGLGLGLGALLCCWSERSGLCE